MLVDVFFRRESNKNFKPDQAVCVKFETDVKSESGTQEELDELLKSAWAEGASMGTHRSGIFEIQTDHGIWQQINGKKLNASRMQLATYTEWGNINWS